MFEDNKYNESDLMMRSIREEGVEEVPAGVWDAVSEGLDKASRKKTVVLAWRRAAVGFGVAAALAVGIVLNHGSGDSLVPDAGQSDMIAVVEPVAEAVEDDSFATDVMMAEVRETPMPKSVRKQPSVPVSMKEINSIPESREEMTDETPEETPSAQPHPTGWRKMKMKEAMSGRRWFFQESPVPTVLR